MKIRSHKIFQHLSSVWSLSVEPHAIECAKVFTENDVGCLSGVETRRRDCSPLNV